MIKRTSKALSFILHPVFMPFLGFLLIFNITHLAMLPFESKKAILSLVGIITVFFPLAVIPVLYYQKFITGITLSNNRERLIPMFLTSVFYYFGYHILHRYSAPSFLQQYMLAVFICVLLASLINLKWKISLHMIGIGGLIGLLSALSHLFAMHINWVMMTAILLAGIIGTSRLILDEHTPPQVYAGFILGYVINFGIIVFFNS